MQNRSPLSQVKRLFLPLALLSSVTNLAVLISPIFMMQVLDRVVPSQNLNTLVLLLGIALLALVLHGIVDFVRDTAFQRTARWVEKSCVAPILAQGGLEKQSHINNLTTLSTAFKGSTMTTAINALWIPLFFVALYFVHISFVLLAVVMVTILIGLKMLVGILQGDQTRQLAQISRMEAEALSNSASFFTLSGMHRLSKNLIARYAGFQAGRHQVEDGLTNFQVAQTATSASLRMATQLLGLSLGAALVVANELSAGGMIAASIILSKTVTTCETAATAIPQLRQTYASYQKLTALFGTPSDRATHIPELSGALTCNNLIYPRGGGAPARLEKVSFKLAPGECLAILGASGSGKTTLLNALCGISPSPIGSVFLDETEIKTISSHSAAVHIGYLPQQAQLFDGTLAQNICAFDTDPDDELIISSAKTAGVHGLISALPNSYDTDIGAEPFLLSAGQKQRVSLARAIYAQPKYLFLDEPNALLDAEGERQLCDALARLKAQGTTIVMVIHRSGVMSLADHVLLLDTGRVQDFGPRADVLSRVAAGKRRIELPINRNSAQDLYDWVGAQFGRGGDEAFCEKARTIASELFDLALTNGTSDGARLAQFDFKFIDDKNCEISLTEKHPTRAAAKMQKIASASAGAGLDTSTLADDELSILAIANLSTALKITNTGDGALFRAGLNNSPTAKAVHH